MIGEVTVTKVYKDGTREVVIKNDRNMITDGMGVSLVNLFSLNPANPRYNLDKFKVGYFQVGTSGVFDKGPVPADFNYWESLVSDSAGNNFYELSAPLALSDYGDNTTLKPVERKILAVSNPFADPSELSYEYRDTVLVEFEDDPVTKIIDNAIHVKINIDEKGCNGKNISELGLFVKNPEVFESRERPALAAYKILYNPILKTEDFSLDIDWVLHFTDVNNGYKKNADTNFLYFVPAVKGSTKQTSVYATYMEEEETYKMSIETPVPVEEDGYLHYSLSGDAVNGIHYSIDKTSPVFMPKGSSKIELTLSCLDVSTEYFSPKKLYVTLDSFTGPRNLPKKHVDLLSDQFLFHLRTNNPAPTVRLAATTDPLPADSSLEVSAVITNNNGGFLYLDEDISVYLQLSSSRALSTSSTYITIPSGIRFGTVTIDTTGTGDVAVSTYNTLTTDPEYNEFAHSNNFGFSRALSTYEFTSQDIEDMVSERYSFVPVNGSGWYEERFMPWSPAYVWFPGDPTLKVHSNYDLWSSFPPLEVFSQLSSLSASAPDGMQNATLCYTPCSIYAWYAKKPNDPTNPGLFAGATKIRREYTSNDPNGINQTPKGDDQRLYFEHTTDGSSIALSVYFKKIDGTKTVGRQTVKASPVINMGIYSRGFPGVTAATAPLHSTVGKSATFSWNETTGGLELDSITADGAWVNNGALSDAGVFSGVGYDSAVYGFDDKWASVEDGWYRAYITALVDVDFTSSGIYAPLTYEGTGAVSQYFIHYNVDSDGNLAQLPGYSDGLYNKTDPGNLTIPVDMSGSILAWGQWEYGISNVVGAKQGFPRDYQHNGDSLFTPLGNCIINPTFKSLLISG